MIRSVQERAQCLWRVLSSTCSVKRENAQLLNVKLKLQLDQGLNQNQQDQDQSLCQLLGQDQDLCPYLQPDQDQDLYLFLLLDQDQDLCHYLLQDQDQDLTWARACSALVTATVPMVGATVSVPVTAQSNQSFLSVEVGSQKCAP